MKKFYRIIPVLALLASVSCSPVKVVIDQDHSTDFSKYETYSFLGWQNGSEALMSEFDRKRMRDAFKSEFDARNLKFVESGGDMNISLFIVLDEKTSVTAYTDYYSAGGYGMYRRYGGWGMGHSTTTYSESDYTQGTLVMDVFDTKSNDQVWQAVATATIAEDPAKREKTIPKKVNAIMKEFPVAPVE